MHEVKLGGSHVGVCDALGCARLCAGAGVCVPAIPEHERVDAAGQVLLLLQGVVRVRAGRWRGPCPGSRDDARAWAASPPGVLRWKLWGGRRRLGPHSSSAGSPRREAARVEAVRRAAAPRSRSAKLQSARAPPALYGERRRLPCVGMRAAMPMPPFEDRRRPRACWIKE